MELKTAIERVERFAAAITWANDDDRQAVALVLAAAKQPGFTVEEIEYLQTAMGQFDPTEWPEYPYAFREPVADKLDAYLTSVVLTNS